MISKNKIYNFFEKPTTPFARSVQIFIFTLIFYSLGVIVFELKYAHIATSYQNFLFYSELFVTICFSAEYLLRFFSSPNKSKFPFKFFNIIDLIAILPFFIGIGSFGSIRSLRVLRLIRLVRFTRFLKLLKHSKEIYNFFENPNTSFSKGVYIFLSSLIFISIGLTLFEYQFPDIAQKYHVYFFSIEIIIVIFFSIEYVLRFIAAPNKKKFPFQIFNIIDLMAVLPFYLGIKHSEIIRILRILRVFKLFRYGTFLKAFKFQSTILQKITPVIIILLISKFIVWFLESRGIWISNNNLGELFAIIGFALGIILSQKIGVAYDKFLQVEDALMRIHGTITSIKIILQNQTNQIETKICHDWLEIFLQTLKMHKFDQNEFDLINIKFYLKIQECEEKPAEMAIMHGDLTRDAIFCFSKGKNTTPKAYDNLLQQSTLFYILLISIFIPGITGVISVLMATYMLYGMYHITIDFDTLFGGEFDLINVDTSELDKLATQI